MENHKDTKTPVLISRRQWSQPKLPKVLTCPGHSPPFQKYSPFLQFYSLSQPSLFLYFHLVSFVRLFSFLSFRIALSTITALPTTVPTRRSISSSRYTTPDKRHLRTNFREEDALDSRLNANHITTPYCFVLTSGLYYLTVSSRHSFNHFVQISHSYIAFNVRQTRSIQSHTCETRLGRSTTTTESASSPRSLDLISRTIGQSPDSL